MIKRFSLYLLFVFLCGVAVGLFGFRFYELRRVSAMGPPPGRSPEEWKARHMKELQSRLHLNPEQVSTLDGIMNESRDRIKRIWDKSKPEFDAVQADQTAAVRKMLNATQDAEYTKFLDERERRRMQDQQRNK